MQKIEQLNKVIGQSLLKQVVTQNVNAVINDGLINSELFMGAAGTGKTHVMKAQYEAYMDAGITCLWFGSPAEFRELGDNFSSIIATIAEADRWAIFIDEAHEFRVTPTQQMRKVLSFIMKWTTANNIGTSQPFDTEISVLVNHKRGGFVLGTNFPHVLDKTGTLQSRLVTRTLAEYSNQELIEILNVMLPFFGLRPASEKTLKIIANCGRGTARPMETIAKQLKQANDANGGTKSTVNREDVIHALKLTEMFPRGLTPWEIKLMVKCQEKQMRDRDILSLNPGLEKGTMDKAKSYLVHECGFMVEARKGLQTTARGIRYLSDIVKDGFEVGGDIMKVGKAEKMEVEIAD